MIDPQRQAFLDAIIAEPHEDVHRLVYADWIDERGEHERAALIRVQCEIAEQESRLGWLTTLDLLDRERELMEWFCSEDLSIDLGFPSHESWYPSSHPGELLSVSMNSTVQFHRGFLRQVVCSWNNWNTHADTITRQHPIEEVRLLTWPVIKRLDSPSLKTRWTLEGRSYKPYWQDDEKDHVSIIRKLLNLIWPTIKFTLEAIPVDSPPMQYYPPSP